MPRGKTYSKKSYRGKRKTKFTRKKKRQGVSAVVMAAETKIQKTIIAMNAPYNTVWAGSFMTTPWQDMKPTDALDVILDPEIVKPVTVVPGPQPDDGNIYNRIGSFIVNGDERDQRNGRRITMLNSSMNFVFHLRAAPPTGDPPVYEYNLNPEFRVVQGWVKGGIDALSLVQDDINGLYTEIPYSRYKVLYDKIISRRALSSGIAQPDGTVSYKKFALNFKWISNRRITFDKSVGGTGVPATIADDCKYTGWVPFLYFYNPHQNLQIYFDNIKRLNLYKDL